MIACSRGARFEGGNALVGAGGHRFGLIRLDSVVGGLIRRLVWLHAMITILYYTIQMQMQDVSFSSLLLTR